MTVIHKIEDEFNILMESSISDNVFSTVEGADNTSMKSETSVQIHIQVLIRSSYANRQED